MTWVDIFEKMIHAITQLAPTIGVVATGWFGMRASKAGNLNKEQFKELKTELNTIHVIGEDNQKNIIEINNKLAVHDEAHLTTVHESDIIHKMHSSYKKLGGNGRIDALFNKYLNLEISEEHTNATDQ